MSAWRICLCAITLALSVANAEATLIDSFAVGKQSLSVDIDGPNDASWITTSSAIGGCRGLELDWTSGDLNFANVSPSGGKFSFTEGTAEGKTSLTWNGASTAGSYLLNKDLTDGGDNAFSIHVIAATGTGLGMTMTVYSDDATHVSQYVGAVAAGGSRDEYVPYSSFSQFGTNPADFTDIDAIVLEFNGVGHVGSDITVGPINTIPEPSTFTLTAIVAMVLGFMGWRQRKA